MQVTPVRVAPVLTQPIGAVKAAATAVPTAQATPAAPQDEVLLSPNPPPPDPQHGVKGSIIGKMLLDTLVEKMSPFPRKRHYHGYDATVQELRDMAAKHPDKALVQSIGKTYEGRDIWALKVTSGAPGDTSARPGVVFTGLHHAREWMSVESSLKLADAMLEGYATDADMKKRVDSAETWIIPIVNPDGYEYTRSTDKSWRKNRSPQDEGQFGVDVNRNYYDANHSQLYRTFDDKPWSTADDVGASDDPASAIFRGPQGNSEAETRAMLDLAMRPNIVGVLDHHSCGEMILRAPDAVITSDTRRKNYDEIGRRMKAVQSKPYTYMATDQLYPTTGDSTAVFEKNGRYGMVIEMGTSFRPAGRKIPSVTKEVVAADLAFLDAMLQVSAGR